MKESFRTSEDAEAIANVPEVPTFTAPSFTPAGSVLQLLLLSTAAWAVIYARGALNPLQEALRLDLALSDNQVALLQGPALGVPMALAAIPLGLLIDRYSRVLLLLLAVALGLIATVLTALASNLTQLLAVRCLIGLAQAVILVGVYSLVADLYAPAQRGRATMVVALGEIGGAPAAFALGGILLAMLGPEPGSTDGGTGAGDWRSALLWMSVPLLPVLFLMLALREPSRSGIVVANPPLRKTWSELWRYRAVILPLLFARIMIWIADGAVYVWAAPTFARRFALTPDRIGAIMGGVLLISGILGPVLGGPLADWCQRSGGPRRTAAVLSLLALLSVPVALFAVMPSPAAASFMLAAFLTLGFTFGTVALTLSTVIIPGEVRGVFLAMSVTVSALFITAVAPVAVSLLSGALGGAAMIGNALTIVCGVTSLLGVAIFALGKRYFPGVAVPGLVQAA